MRKPLVSIVIPVFNGANYIRAAIESALAQTWSAVEVIVVNDGSTDNGATAEIAHSYKDRIRYIEKLNGGVASALNTGISAMRGEVFCWLSHDDRYLPNKIARQVAAWDRSGDSRPRTCIYTDYRLIDSSGEKIGNVILDHGMLAGKPEYAVLRGAIHGCSVFIPKSVLGIVGTFNEALPTTQDYDLWLRMILAGFEFVHLPELLIESRCHPEQASKKAEHIAEADEFWTRAVHETPAHVRERLEGSNGKFLTEMANFLRQNSFVHAASEVASSARNFVPLVSVVIPVFNRFHLLAAAVDSVLLQTHPAIEIIIVDDGSTEERAILDDVASSSPTIRLLRQKNQGPASARNTGWNAASGEYVAFLDADDIFLPRKIELQLAAMVVSDCAFSHTSYFRHRQGDTTPMSRRDTGATNSFPAVIRECSIATPTVMLLTALRNEFSFPEHIKFGEDNVLWLDIAAKYGIEGIDQALTVVMTSPNSAAYDLEKHSAGLRNIHAHILNSPSLWVHDDEVSRFVENATAIGVPLK